MQHIIVLILIVFLVGCVPVNEENTIGDEEKVESKERETTKPELDGGSIKENNQNENSIHKENNEKNSNKNNEDEESIEKEREKETIIENNEQETTIEIESEIEETITETEVEETVEEVTETIPKQTFKRLVAFGDSLTYGETLTNPETENWAYLVSQDFNLDFANFAVSGAFVSDVRYNQIPVYESKENDLVIIWIGSNDARLFNSLTEFKDHYENMIKLLENEEVILVNIPDISEFVDNEVITNQLNSMLTEMGLGFTLAYIDAESAVNLIMEEYNIIIQQLANENGIKVIDVFSEPIFDPELLAEDNFHPNKGGQEKIAEFIQKEISTIIDI